MRRVVVPVLGAVLLVAGLAVGTSQQASAGPGDRWPAAAAAMAEEFGLTTGEAIERLNRQPAAEALAGEARQVFDSSFAGLWIDHDNGGTVTVGFAGPVDGAGLADLAAEHGLTDHVEGVSVPFALQFLEESVADLAADLPAANSGARVAISVGLRTDLNRVELTTPSEPTAAQASFVSGARVRLGAALRVLTVNVPPRPAACAYPYCDPPLRGGVAVHGGALTCTAGFMATSTVSTARYVLTAGHCAAGAPAAVWFTRYPDSSAHDIGAPQDWTFGAGGDMAILRIGDPAGWDPAPWVYMTGTGWLYPTTADEAHPIIATGPGTPLVGEYVCKTGQTSGTSCGRVRATGVSVTYSGTTTVHDLVRATMSVCKGDSGGPVYGNGTAHGLVSGGLLVGNCGTTLYYQGVRSAADALDVTVQLAP